MYNNLKVTKHVCFIIYILSVQCNNRSVQIMDKIQLQKNNALLCKKSLSAPCDIIASLADEVIFLRIK